jgi:hypothetical protein
MTKIQTYTTYHIEFHTMSDEDIGPYAKLAQNMTPNLLVSFNNSGNANAYATDELRVVRVSGGPEVYLEDTNGVTYLFAPTQTDEGDLCEVDEYGALGGWLTVETIEIVGIA